MKITVRYFASLREALGPGESLELPAGSTVDSLRDALVARGGRHAEVLAEGRAVRCALNQQMCEGSTPLEADAELAFFPPVTGG
ncbi:MAG: molybdopterin converting factor subunit 1 [Rubrivivax sp.]|nr:molybdopterin converting factor subunit 1 [Rubrivivax sp.]